MEFMRLDWECMSDKGRLKASGVASASSQVLDKAIHHRQGGAQFVGNIGHEVPADLIEMIDLSDIPGYQQPLPLFTAKRRHS